MIECKRSFIRESAKKFLVYLALKWSGAKSLIEEDIFLCLLERPQIKDNRKKLEKGLIGCSGVEDSFSCSYTKTWMLNGEYYPIELLTETDSLYELRDKGELIDIRAALIVLGVGRDLSSTSTSIGYLVMLMLARILRPGGKVKMQLAIGEKAMIVVGEMRIFAREEIEFVRKNIDNGEGKMELVEREVKGDILIERSGLRIGRVYEYQLTKMNGANQGVDDLS